ncbi:glutathione transferase [Purpureocillium lilacinum]|uniref:Glutathione transferase n=1 Tax=Purpureocillium lilacinum TaxID=33203 RepID=A0A179HPF2_PURLI|nr:glutathione transferase [Purpureocillium lilacinum]OAQ91558.1 glutathione transferase [Purpureocillium lilacinum]
MAAYAGESHFRLNLGVGPGGAGLDGFAHPGPPHHHGHTHDAGPTTAGLDGAYPLQDVAATATPPSAGRRRRRQAADAGSSSTGGQFGILAPTTIPGAGPASAVPLPDAHGQPAGVPTVGLGRDTGERTGGKLSGRIVLDPPNLQAWREKLFAVDETLVLTNEQFEVYFPHVDNIYSHRSTQRYKRKPFISHYYDCRMKGRPPGTPKSDDPNKKKRKRVARERDLCDVKIRITEYFPGAFLDRDTAAAAAAAAATGNAAVLTAGAGAATGVAAQVVPEGQRFWAIQRVNGNGGNGKGDGIDGPHRHTLQRSDEIKRNSVQRWLADRDKEVKKIQKQVPRKATGAALATTKKHSKESDLKLYAACFCPFSQRVWIALEAKGLAYQYCETDPYRRPAPTALLEANPRGLVPAIRQGEWACAESAVILEYLEDMQHRSGAPLFPSDPRLKANCRLWIDHINARVVPSFFALLQAPDLGQQSAATEQLQGHITSLVLAADEHGPYFLGSSLSLVDVHFAPFALRLSRVLGPLRGWADPVPGTRWQRWLDALERDPHVTATTSLDELYADTAQILAHPHAPSSTHLGRR